ncbi:hypothetical protein D4764_14G0004140 [Takifugu flavidus]|uniref:Uncharacterized protein n=1 Tax=Takifugu flavidus TaxID=433684 RepID=A0A5C6P6H6_9TELE|nr:hypothetical protein D4764_14G0004140 [Takifugu flavidus]
MRRRHLSIGARTTVAQRLPVDYQKRVAIFRTYCRDKITAPSHITNMDEIPLTFDIPLTHKVVKKGPARWRYVQRAPPQAVPLDPPGALDPLALNTNPFLGPFPSGAQYRNYHMQDNTVQMYPLIQVANPQAGVQGQDPTILVYRTWTPEDCKKACDDVTLPQMDVELCIQDIRQLLRSYHTNGTETQQVLMCVNGKKWGTVRGDWVPVDPATQQPWQPGSQELNDRLDRLYERMRTTFTRRADYSAITATRQKTDESFEDYSMRMKDVFRKIVEFRMRKNQKVPTNSS